MLTRSVIAVIADSFEYFIYRDSRWNFFLESFLVIRLADESGGI